MEIPFQALLGGILIGLSATLLFWLYGKIAGISNIVWRTFSKTDKHHRLANLVFLAGLIVGCLCYHWLTGNPVTAVTKNNYSLAIIAGLLVGIGVKVGNGCTSGHGVCGISRLSFRSLIATLIFMLTAILTVFFVGN